MLWVYSFWYTYGLVHETLPMAARPVLTASAPTGPLSGPAMATRTPGNQGTVLGLFPDAQGRT